MVYECLWYLNYGIHGVYKPTYTSRGGPPGPHVRNSQFSKPTYLSCGQWLLNPRFCGWRNELLRKPKLEIHWITAEDELYFAKDVFLTSEWIMPGCNCIVSVCTAHVRAKLHVCSGQNEVVAPALMNLGAQNSSNDFGAVSWNTCQMSWTCCATDHIQGMFFGLFNYNLTTAWDWMSWIGGSGPIGGSCSQGELVNSHLNGWFTAWTLHLYASFFSDAYP